MRILFVGDIHGKAGRRSLRDRLPGLRQAHDVGLVILNGENSAGGAGINAETAQELFAPGADAITGGNHTWQLRAAHELLDRDPRLLRPLNYPPAAPGRGAPVPTGHTATPAGLINLQGPAVM